MEAYRTIEHNSHMALYRAPFGAVPAGEQVRLRIRVPLFFNATVFLRVWDGKQHILPMQKEGELHSIDLDCPKIGLVFYYFILHTSSGTLYYLNNSERLGGKGECCLYAQDQRSFQITVYEPGFTVPSWCKEAVLYQIFPDRFAPSGDFSPGLGRKKHAVWSEAPDYLPGAEKGYYAADDFFGGSLRGIQARLPYLQALGVTTVYLNPIFQGYANHRYDTGDYEKIDGILGTNEDFEQLCKRADDAGIRIILDGVFSHTGSDSKYFNRESRYAEIGAFNSPDSKYYPWYTFKQYPDDYDCWWGVWSLPAVRELEPSYMQYILTGPNAIVPRWLRAGAAGWRLDVADELPDEFLCELRRQVKQVDKDALIVGEVWEDASNKESYGHLRPYLLGNQLDSVMNYPLRGAILNYLRCYDAAAFKARVDSLQENYPPQVFACLMNFISTHDTERAITLLGGAPAKESLTREQQAEYILSDAQYTLGRARLMLAYTILFMLPGMPCIYYGDEAGLQGYADPFNRGTFPWGNEDTTLQNTIATLAGLRKQANISGSLTLLAAGSALCIKRTLMGKSTVCIINPADEVLEQVLDPGLLRDGEIVFKTGTAHAAVRENGMYLLLSPVSCCIIKERL